MKDKELRFTVDCLRSQVEQHRKDYWELYEKIKLLSDHLNVSFDQVNAHLRLVKKGGPEQP